MSAKLNIVLLFSISICSTFSQDYKYMPLPDSNCIWSEKYTPPFNSWDPPTYYIYALFNEDTVINSIKYQKLFVLYDSIIEKNRATYLGAIREDSTRKVYYQGDYLFFSINSNRLNDNNELLLYDFSVNVGDTLRNLNFALLDEFLVVSSVDTLEILNSKRRVISFEWFPILKWIEGIGSVRGLLVHSGSFPTNGLKNELICFRKDESMVYLNTNYYQCFNFPSWVSESRNHTLVGVHPNPVYGISYLNIDKSFDRLEIFSCMGECIIDEDISNLKYFEINASHFESGIFLFRISSPNKPYINGRFVIAK